MFKNKRVLVTGGLGFIGSNLAIRLVGLGAKVTIVDALISGHGGNYFNIAPIKNRVIVKILNLKDEKKVKLLLVDQEYVFNLAGSVSHLNSMTNPHQDLESNVEAHISLLEGLRKVNSKAKIVFASTRQVYGNPKYLPVNEEHPVDPVDINGINKYAAEQLHLLYSKRYSIPVVILRLTNTYGPRQLICHNRQGFIGWFIHQAVEGDVIKLFDGGRQIRDLNFIDDVVEAFLLAAREEKTNGNIFNLGSKDVVSLSEIARKLILLTGKGKMVSVAFPGKEKSIGIADVFLDFSKIKKKLGWTPKIKLDKGLEQTIKYFKKYGKYYI